MCVLGWDKLQSRKDEIFQDRSYDESCFQNSSYDLRVGDEESLIDGKYLVVGVSKQTGLIEIPAGQIAFLSTVEKLKLPIDLVGKIGLRFTYTRKGLIPLLGPQVDPLYQGRLYIAVYNLGENPIYLKPRDKLFNIEFHTVLTDYLSLEGKPEHFPARPVKRLDGLPSDVISEWQGTRMVSNSPRLANLEHELEDLKLTLEAQSATSQYIIIGGVFLITITILGAILQTMFGIAASQAWMTTDSLILNGNSALILAIAPYAFFLFSVAIVATSLNSIAKKMAPFKSRSMTRLIHAASTTADADAGTTANKL